MAYRIAQSSMTLSDIQGYSPIASLFKCDFGIAQQQLTGSQLPMHVERSVWRHLVVYGRPM